MKKFLKDVFHTSLLAYGGPEAHYAVFTDQLVQKHKYLTEEELAELIALCTVLPGPTSTETITSIGYKVGGPKLAFLTLLVWATPAILFMTLLSFITVTLAKEVPNIFHYIVPVAIALIIIASIRINQKVHKGWFTVLLAVIAFIITQLINNPVIYPVLIIFGGISSVFKSKEPIKFKKFTVKPNWIYALVFSGILIVTLFRGTEHTLFSTFARFYEYGAVVYGGGQVVIPMMYSELVNYLGFMTNEQFMTGYGLVQGIPGPMFSFASFVGGLSHTDNATIHILGGILAGIGIFLPGLLMILFVFPIWEELKMNQIIKHAINGFVGIAGGLIVSSALTLFLKMEVSVSNIIVLLLSLVLIYTKKVPTILVIAVSILLGIIL